MIDPATGNEAELPNDCSDACQLMLGAGSTGYLAYVARNMRGSTEEFTSPTITVEDDLAPGGTLSTTEILSREIYVCASSNGNLTSHWRPLMLSRPGINWIGHQSQLSEKYGINRFAVPAPGQGITISSERDMPGGEAHAL